MLHQRKSFTVPATGKALIACDHATAMADRWGKCIRCGEKIRDSEAERRQGMSLHTIDGLAKR